MVSRNRQRESAKRRIAFVRFAFNPQDYLFNVIYILNALYQSHDLGETDLLAEFPAGLIWSAGQGMYKPVQPCSDRRLRGRGLIQARGNDRNFNHHLCIIRSADMNMS